MTDVTNNKYKHEETTMIMCIESGRHKVSTLTNNIRMIKTFQDLCFLIQTLLVNFHLLSGTFTVDLLHGPW